MIARPAPLLPPPPFCKSTSSGSSGWGLWLRHACFNLSNKLCKPTSSNLQGTSTAVAGAGDGNVIQVQPSSSEADWVLSTTGLQTAKRRCPVPNACSHLPFCMPECVCQQESTLNSWVSLGFPPHAAKGSCNSAPHTHVHCVVVASLPIRSCNRWNPITSHAQPMQVCLDCQ